MRLRLVSYNIHKGIGGIDRRYRPERIIETLRRYEPDVVMLQEVDEGVPRSRGHRQVDLLGDALDLEGRAFQRNVRLRKGYYGNAILSRFPLTDVGHLDLSVPLKKRRRALLARCAVGPRKRKSLLLVNCHLGLAEYERALQLRHLLALRDLGRARRDAPIIVAGDFNDVWNTLGTRFMQPAGFQLATGGSRTFPAVMPMRALDHVFYRGGLEALRGFASRSRISREASDHRPLIVDFEV